MVCLQKKIEEELKSKIKELEDKVDAKNEVLRKSNEEMTKAVGQPNIIYARFYFILFYFNSKETYFINLWIKHIKIKGIRSITPSQLEAKIEARLAPKSLVNHIYMHDFVVQCKSCFVCIQITSLLDTYFSRRTPRSRVQGLVQGDQVCIQILRSFKMNN